jgi:type IV secretory pathway VirB9-like protein
MRFLPLMLVVCLLALNSCQKGPPPEPEAEPPAEDLSQWTLPELVEPEPRRPFPEAPWPRPASAAEKVYDFAPGGVYKVDVSIEAPLDIILEPGEKVRDLLGRDPKPIIVPPDQTHAQGQQAPSRWEYKEGGDGLGDQNTPHIFLLVREANATLGLTVTTTRRIYYLDCRSVTKSPTRAVRWKYPHNAFAAAAQEAKPPGILPAPEVSKRYHVGYQWQTSQPAPVWTPRQVVDDGKKLYLIYPEVVLFGTVPLVRAVGPNGPQVVNTRQFLNVVILDALVPKVELGVGLGEKAERVTITRGVLRTIQCPEDAACPQWPAAAQQLQGR